MDTWCLQRWIIVLLLLVVAAERRSNYGLREPKMTTDSEQNSVNPRLLRLTAYNSRGLTAATKYICELLRESDILALSEHHLYETQLHKLQELDQNFCMYGKSSSVLDPKMCGKLPGHGGVALMWRKSMSCCIKPVKDLGSDRMCAIQICMGEHFRDLFIIAVYLPQVTCKNQIMFNRSIC